MLHCCCGGGGTGSINQGGNACYPCAVIPSFLTLTATNYPGGGSGEDFDTVFAAGTVLPFLTSYPAGYTACAGIGPAYISPEMTGHYTGYPFRVIIPCNFTSWRLYPCYADSSPAGAGFTGWKTFTMAASGTPTGPTVNTCSSSPFGLHLHRINDVGFSYPDILTLDGGT